MGNPVIITHSLCMIRILGLLLLIIKLDKRLHLLGIILDMLLFLFHIFFHSGVFHHREYLERSHVPLRLEGLHFALFQGEVFFLDHLVGFLLLFHRAMTFLHHFFIISLLSLFLVALLDLIGTVKHGMFEKHRH